MCTNLSFPSSAPALTRQGPHTPRSLSLPLPAGVPGSECRGLPRQQQRPRNRLCLVSPYRTTSPLRTGSSLPYSPVGSILPPGLLILRDWGEEKESWKGSGQPTGYCSPLPRDSEAGAPSPHALQGAPIPASTAHILCAAHSPVPGV